MKVTKRYSFAFFGAGVLLLGLLSAASAQQVNGLAEVATGEGTLVVENGPSMQIKAVAVFLRENGEAEILLMTAKENVHVGGRWVRNPSVRGAIDLDVTNDTQGGHASGCGTVFLQNGCVPVANLTITVFKADGTSYDAAFITSDSLCEKPLTARGRTTTAPR